MPSPVSSPPPDASSVRRGVVSITTQSFGGPKSFDSIYVSGSSFVSGTLVVDGKLTGSGGFLFSGGRKNIVISGSNSFLKFDASASDNHMLVMYRNSNNAGPSWDVGSLFNSQGAYYSNAWMVISGNPALTPDSDGIYLPQAPTSDPFMIGVWGDVVGPSFVSRVAPIDPTGYHLLGMDKFGKYTFSIEEYGELQWGTGSAHSSFWDTKLYRTGSAALRTNGSFIVDVGLTASTVIFQTSGSKNMIYAQNQANDAAWPIVQQDDANRIIFGHWNMGGGLRFYGAEPDSASAVAFAFDTNVSTLSTPGSKLLSLRNNGAEKFAVDFSGAITSSYVTGSTQTQWRTTILSGTNVPWNSVFGGVQHNNSFDPTWTYGYNADNGGRVVSGSARFADVIEGDWEEPSGTHLFERYWEAWNAADDVRLRPLFCNFDKQTGSSTIQLYGHDGNSGGTGFVTLGVGSTQVLKVVTGGFQMLTGSITFVSGGAKSLIRSSNVAGSQTHDVLQLYSSNDLGLGGTGAVRVSLTASKVGFYSTDPISKPTVTGSMGGNAALQSLMVALRNLGIVTDNTT